MFCNCLDDRNQRFWSRIDLKPVKPIAKDELYEHTSQFLKARGIEMKEGSYTKQIQKGFGLLTDAINLTHKGIERASAEVDTKLDQLRQMIHEKTAPKPAANGPATEPPPTPGASVKEKPVAKSSSRANAGAKKRQPVAGKRRSKS